MYLKISPNTLRVFIHAPWEFRVEKASEKISGSREDVEKFLLKDDKRKQDYYRKFAGGHLERCDKLRSLSEQRKTRI